MKKITLITLLFAGFQMNAQTIVQTTPQNKKVILEEFTGVNCVYCPQGHTIANAIKASNPTNVFLINIHVGGYATPSAGQPDFRTPFGTAIVNQTGLVGYPAGTLNRTVFTGSAQNGTTGTAMSRNFWTAASNQTVAQSSYVNVATTATINATTRLLTVLVEAYYTGSSPVTTNKLNVALLQNNTTGAQVGGNQGDNYNHQHRLIHMLTGQWGETINTTTAGTFVTRTYTYTIPADYNNIIAEMGEFEIVAFMAETQQKIISGNGAVPTYTGLATSDVKLKEVESIENQCAASIAPKIKIQNYGQNALTTLPITYSINGGTPQIYNWTGNLVSFAKESVTLPAITYNLINSNVLNVSIPADANVSDNTGSVTFAKAAVTTNTNITIKITLDRYGSETSWQLLNSSNTPMATSPTYTDAATSGEYPQPDINLTLPFDCYKFIINDAFGDGMDSGYGVGSYQVLANAVVIPGIEGGAFGSSESKVFQVANILGVENFTTNEITLYPNPSNGIFIISTQLPTDVVAIDVTGKEVFRMLNINNQTTLNLTQLQKGLYLLKLSNELGEQTKKIIIE
ncbi:Omp28-related outer membrane protein [Flavobacterium sp.]|uniref:T9SS type A sorting domain-containing protein n=1 Tax=Flavobacterium sp. TaxID=239 RepID=UPI003342C64D